MSQAKPVTWFADDPKPNTFFFRSPFRSWQFAANTALALCVCAVVFVSVWRHWGEISRPSGIPGILLLLWLFVISQYLFALKRHGEIHELYLSGQITDQPAGSPLDQLLGVAANSMHDGLRNSAVISGAFFLGYIFWKLPHLR